MCTRRKTCPKKKETFSPLLIGFSTPGWGHDPRATPRFGVVTHLIKQYSKVVLHRPHQLREGHDPKSNGLNGLTDAAVAPPQGVATQLGVTTPIGGARPQVEWQDLNRLT